MLTPAERLSLHMGRTKPKWDFHFASHEILVFHLNANRELIVDYEPIYDGWLCNVVFVEGGFDRFMDSLEPGEITYMYVKSFDFTDSHMRSLCGALARHQPKELHIGDCGVDDVCAEILAVSLPSCLCAVQAYGIRVSQMGLLAIAKAVAKISTAANRETPFTRLALCGAKMGDDCFAVCEVLPQIKGLVELNVSLNGLTDRGLEAFAKVLNRCETLKEVKFSHNKITSLAALYAPLRESRTLKDLYFKDNMAIGSEGALGLLGALFPHSSVEYVNLWRAGVSSDLQELIHDKLKLMHCRKTKALLTLLSVRGAPRLGSNSALRRLPKDHLRLVAMMLK